jgi:hypothetical protein
MLLEDAYVKFLIEHNLTQSQYLLLHLVYKDRGDLIREYKKVFPSEDGTMIGQWQINDLINRGFLVKDLNDRIKIGKKFLEIFINKHTASEEIFEIYPTHFHKDGAEIPLSAMDRNVFANLYDNAIQSSVLEHLEVIEDIKFAMLNNLLSIGLEKFVKSKYWLMIRPRRLSYKEKEEIELRRDHDF